MHIWWKPFQINLLVVGNNFYVLLLTEILGVLPATVIVVCEDVCCLFPFLYKLYIQFKEIGLWRNLSSLLLSETKAINSLQNEKWIFTFPNLQDYMELTWPCPLTHYMYMKHSGTSKVLQGGKGRTTQYWSTVSKGPGLTSAVAQKRHWYQCKMLLFLNAYIFILWQYECKGYSFYHIPVWSLWNTHLLRAWGNDLGQSKE